MDQSIAATATRLERIVEERPDNYILWDAAKLLEEEVVDRYMAATVFGLGVTIDGKFRPRYANPDKKPPPRIDTFTGTRNPRRLDMKRLLRHVAGSQPHFEINMAHRRRRAWTNESGVGALLHELQIHPDEDCGGLRGYLELVDSLLGRKPPLSLTLAEKLLRIVPGSDKFSQEWQPLQGKDLLTRLKRALLAVEPKSHEYWMVNRAIHRATGHRHVPIGQHEITMDIDGDKNDPTAPMAAKAMAEQIASDLFGPLRVQQFIEPSRNRFGAYLRLRVRREALEEPWEFNNLLRQFTAYLRKRYGGPGEGLPCWVDKVGGKIAYWENNPKFDEDQFYTQEPGFKLSKGERYEFLRRNHGHDDIRWAYDGRFEPYLLRARDLITLPLSNLPADPDGGARRLAEYHEYAQSRSSCPESSLRAMIESSDSNVNPSVVPAADSIRRAASARSTTAAPKVRQPPKKRSGKLESVGGCQPIQIDVPQDEGGLRSRYGQSKNLSIFLDPIADQFARYGAACRMALRRQGAADLTRVEAEAIALVELPIGPATGPRHSGRLDETRRIIRHWSETFKPFQTGAPKDSHQGQPHFTAADIAENEQWVRGRISRRMIAVAVAKHPRAKIDYTTLAHALLLMQKNVHTGALTEVSANSIQKGLKHLGLPYSGGTVAAIIELLIHRRARLLVQVGNACTFPSRTHCRRFVLHPKCPVGKWLTKCFEVSNLIIHGNTSSIHPSPTTVVCQQPVGQQLVQIQPSLKMLCFAEWTGPCGYGPSPSPPPPLPLSVDKQYAVHSYSYKRQRERREQPQNLFLKASLPQEASVTGIFADIG